MEIDKTSFKGSLLHILESLMEAPFVSIDCEMSGVASKSRSGERQTLQQRYAEVKEAAEKYTILQIGITPVTVQECDEVDKNGQYIERDPQYLLRPFNFDLNPLIEEKVDIERIFSFQSGAVDFLMRHGFQMDRPFTHGVPYLSRAEAEAAKRVAIEHLDKSTLVDLQLGPDHIDALAFVEKSRIELNEWTRTRGHGELFISSRNYPSETSGRGPDGELTRFEQRLVHQLVRAEFPSLISMGKNSKVVIRIKDEKRERQRMEARLADIDRAIKRQTGLRWVVDALAGSPLIDLTPDMVAYDPVTGARNDFSPRSYGYGARIDRVRQRLRGQRPVLVGHNMFTDLVYFYRTFIGPLPDTVDEFAAEIHELFPMIVDTKYMATHNCSDINPISSLEEINDELLDQAKPQIALAPSFDITESKPHQAGYDSCLTARVMILLSAKLEAAGEYAQYSPSLHHAAPITATTDLGTSALDPTSANFIPGSLCHTNLPANVQVQAEPPRARTHQELYQVAPPAIPNGAHLIAHQTHGAAEHIGYPDFQVGQRSRFSHANPFDGLSTLQLDGTRELGDRPHSAPEAIRHGEICGPGELQGRMPSFDSDFWQIYGNKLRVFGTVETVLNLAPNEGA